MQVRETDLTSHGIQEDMDKMVSGQSSPLSPSLFLSTLLLGLIWTRDQIHCMWLCACLQVCRTNLLSHLVSGWLSLMATWRETLPLPSLASRTEEKRREREERVDQHPPVCLKILWSQNKLMTRWELGKRERGGSSVRSSLRALSIAPIAGVVQWVASLWCHIMPPSSSPPSVTFFLWLATGGLGHTLNTATEF